MKSKLMDNRIVWVDYAKSIGIFLVVLAHTMLYEPLQNWIYVFHMPLFFFLSGYLFSFKRHSDLSSFVKLRFRNLIIPYISFNVITYLIWLLVLRHVGHGSSIGISWWEPITNALLGNGKQMVHDVPLWFLLCLFIVEISYYLFYHANKNKIIITIFFFIIGGTIYAFCPIRLPFSLGTACVAMVFYSIGQFACNDNKIMKKKKTTLFLVSLILTIVIAHVNGRINMHVNYYGNYLLFFVGAIAGISIIIYICQWLSNLGKNRLIETISRNTITICGIHLTVFALVKGVMVYLLSIQPDALKDGIIGNAIFAMICFSLSLIIAVVIDRFFPFIIGRQRFKH